MPLQSLIESMLLPPGVIVVALLASFVLLLLRRRGWGLALLLAASLALLLLSLEPVAGALTRPLEDRYPPLAIDRARAFAPEAVVVLSGGVVPDSPEEAGRGSPAAGYLKRLLYGAEIARELGLPLVISGGAAPGETVPEAAAGLRALSEAGLRPGRVLLEEHSQDTWENAADVARQFPFKRVILVTSAYHLPRAMYAFARHRLAAFPAPADYRAARGGYAATAYLPSAGSLDLSFVAIHEELGLLFYRARR